MSQRSNSEQYFEIVEKFLDKIFLYPEIMHEHVLFMKRFPDIEWFNIAGILLQKPNALFVKSKAAWDEYCEHEIHIRKNAKSIRIAVPKTADNSLKFVLVPCYDIQDIDEKNITHLKSPIQKVIDQFQGMERINNLLESKNTSFENCVEEVVSVEQFFNEQSHEVQELIINYILASLEKYTQNKVQLTSLKISNPLDIYAFIHEMISKLPEYIENVLIVIEQREQKKEERKDILRKAQRNVTERRIEAQKIYYQRLNNAGREKIIEDIVVDDEGIPIPFESEVY